jgi:hypothetical protein
VKIFKTLGLKNRATGGSIGENTVLLLELFWSPLLLQNLSFIYFLESFWLRFLTGVEFWLFGARFWQKLKRH